jgi:hypothetical protein
MAVIEEVDNENETSEGVETNAEPQKADDNEETEVTSASSSPTPAAAPAAPAAPEIKLSQILPMIAMFGIQKFDLEKLGYKHHVEVAYVVTQVVCLTVMYLIYDRINKMADNGQKIKIPEVKSMGQVVAPAKEQTAKEYDMEKLKEAVKQPLIGFLIIGGIYYKWGSLLPLVMQVLMSPMQLYESPLCQIHFMGKQLKRPFPQPSMFGLPSAPEPAAPEGSAATEKKDK